MIHTRTALTTIALAAAVALSAHAAPATKLGDKAKPADVGDAAGGKPVKPQFGEWGVSKEVRGTDGWYLYAFSDPTKKQVLGMIITNMAPESIEKGDLADRLTFRLNGGGQIKLGGNRGVWYMVATEQGGIRQRMMQAPNFKEHPVDRYKRLWEADPTLTLKRYIETDDLLKAVAAKDGGALPGAAPAIVRGAEAVDMDKPLGPQLEHAVMIGDAAMLRELLRHDVDVNAETTRGDTLLTQAVSFGRLDAIDLLLKAGAKVDEPNKRGETPLRLAASRNHLRIARLLLEAEADPDVPDARKRTALAECVDTNRLTMAELLLKHGASPAKAVDIRGRPALHEAASDNHVEMARLLLDAKVDVNAADDRGQTALHVAVEAGHVKMVEALLAAGAKTDIADRYKQTPITTAERRNRFEILDMLRKQAK